MMGLSAASCQSGDKDYTNPDLPVSERVSALMSQMTLEEKVAQMCQYVGLEHMKKAEKDMSAEDLRHSHSQGFYPGLHSSDVEEMTKKGMIGSFLHVVKAEEANYLQSLAQQSRLKIPLLIGIDAIHGNGLYCGSTIYPTPIGQAATFDLRSLNGCLVRRLSKCGQAACTGRSPRTWKLPVTPVGDVWVRHSGKTLIWLDRWERLPYADFRRRISREMIRLSPAPSIL